jgi:hypothetical protein
MTIYAESLGLEICEVVAKSTCGLRKLCAAYPHWPDASLILEWANSDDAFGQRYARAKMLQIQLLADDIIDISADGAHDTITKVDKHGNSYQSCDHEWLGRSRLRVDSAKWLASKLLPKIYGEKLQIETVKDDSLSKAIEHVKKIKEEAAHGRVTKITD